MNLLKHLIGLILLVVVVTFIGMGQAHAFVWSDPIMQNACESGGFTYKAVNCFRAALQGTLNQFLSKSNGTNLKDFYEDTMNVAAVLAMAIYGLRISLGEVRSISGESVLFIIKIGAAYLVIDNFADPAPSPTIPISFNGLIDISEDLINKVTGAFISESDSQFSLLGSCASKLNLGVLDPMDPGERWDAFIWARVDCMIGGFMGFGLMSGAVTSGVGLILESATASSANNELFGSIGPLIVYMGYSMMFGLFMSILRAVYMFLYSMVLLSFMWLLFPAAMICLLFKHTSSYFFNWLSIVISCLLQPMMVLAYLALMMTAMDAAIYTSPYSLLASITGKTACDSAGCDYANWPKLIQEAKTTGRIADCNINTVSINNSPFAQKDCLSVSGAVTDNGGGAANTRYTDPYRYDRTKPECKSKMPGALSAAFAGFQGSTNLQIPTSCLNGPNPEEMFVAFLVLVVLGTVLYQTMEYIPNFVGTLSGGMGMGGVAATMPLSQEIMGGARQSARALIDSKDPKEAGKAFGIGAIRSSPFADIADAVAKGMEKNKILREQGTQGGGNGVKY